MKTKEELSALRAEVETLKEKLSELSDEELAAVAGGAWGTGITVDPWKDADGTASTIVKDEDVIWLYETSFDTAENPKNPK